MGIHVIRTPGEYAAALLENEQQSCGPLLFASSFLSSIYFSESAIRSFYPQSIPSCQEACGALLRRRKLAIERSVACDRRELYEADAFARFLSDGTVHTQDSAFRSRPSEIRHVFTSMLSWIREKKTLQLAVTTEVLPVVFTLYSSSCVVIDVRTNYLYQCIQGFIIENDSDSVSVFKDEFERLWNNAIVQMPLKAVELLIEENLRQWESGDRIDVGKWPRMRTSDRQ